MSAEENVYELAAARALALYAQQLIEPYQQDAGPANQQAIYKMVQSLGCVQIDSLHVVERSQYLVLWSRLGN